MKYLMGIDMGGTIVKAALFDMKGNEVATYGEKLTILYPGHDMVERDMNEAKEMTYLSIRETLKNSGVSGDDVLAIGVTGQGNGAYLVDEFGNPAWNAIMSSDMRAKDYVKKWYADGTFEKVHAYTYQQLWSGNTSVLIRWFKDNHPDVLDKTKYIMTAKDYMRSLLTGRYNSEITEATGCSLTDIKKKTYSSEVFKLLGIGGMIEKMPPIIDSCDTGGYITKEVSSLTGLKAGTPVVGGLFDVAASIISTGVTDDSMLGIVVGSWGINSLINKNLNNDKELFMNYCYCIPGYYVHMEGSSTSATNQEWFIDNLMERDRNAYMECGEMVESTPYKDTVFFLPFLYGSHVNIDAKAMFVGLQGEHTKAHMMRALYEGVVFCHKMHIERLIKNKPMPSIIRIAGGASRSETWMQIFADVMGVNIDVPQASELGAMGAALCAGVAVGKFSDIKNAAEKWTKIRKVYKPNEERHQYYKKKYSVYKRIIEQMDCVWADIEALK